MPNKKSGLKELRKTKKRTVTNLRKKRTIKELAKSMLKAVEDGDAAEAKKLFPEFQKQIDKAAKTNLIKKNNASRKKSRMSAAIKEAAKK